MCVCGHALVGNILSAKLRRSLVVVRSAESTTLDCFFSANENNRFTRGCLCLSALFAKGRLLFEAILGGQFFCKHQRIRGRSGISDA